MAPPRLRKLSWDSIPKLKGDLGDLQIIWLGAEGDRRRPGIYYIHMRPDQVAPRHSHPGWAVSIIVEGSCKFNGVEYGPGEALLAEAGAVYGPLEPGPEGVTLFEIFEAEEKIDPQWEDPEDPRIKNLWASLGGKPWERQDA